MWVRRGTVEPVSIVWASREKPISATSTMNDSRSLCFSIFLWRYSSTKAGDPSGVPRMFTPSFSGHVSAVRKLSC